MMTAFLVGFGAASCAALVVLVACLAVRCARLETELSTAQQERDAALSCVSGRIEDIAAGRAHTP